MKRKTVICLLMLCIIYLCAAVTLASEGTQRGSITVVMRSGEETAPGSVLALHYIGPETEHALTPEYAAELETRLQGDPGQRYRVGTDGKVVFGDLALGVYLISQPEAAPGYLRMRPFLVSLPLWQDGQLIYDVCASPKMEKAPEDPVLPDTGQPPLLVFPLLVSGGMLLLLLKRERNE